MSRKLQVEPKSSWLIMGYSPPTFHPFLCTRVELRKFDELPMLFRRSVPLALRQNILADKKFKDVLASISNVDDSISNLLRFL